MKTRFYSSKVASDTQIGFNENRWVVSVLNSGSKKSGHSIIVIEGLKPKPGNELFNKLYIGQFELLAVVDDSINPKGYVSEIRCFETNEYNSNHDRYKKMQSRSWIVLATDALTIIQSIKQDIQKLENNERIEYQFFPLTSGSIIKKTDQYGNTADAVNCAKWCQEKLEAGGIIDYSPLKLPEKVAGGWYCTIS